MQTVKVPITKGSIHSQVVGEMKVCEKIAKLLCHPDLVSFFPIVDHTDPSNLKLIGLGICPINKGGPS